MFSSTAAVTSDSPEEGEVNEVEEEEEEAQHAPTVSPPPPLLQGVRCPVVCPELPAGESLL